MEQRHIGSLSVSAVGIGCNNFGPRMDQQAVTAVVDTAIDAGINFFDTADVYGNGGSEKMLRAAIKGRRDKAVIATKFGHSMGDVGGTGASPAWIRTAIENSLRRLGVDHVDLYQQHVPDAHTPIAETLGVLHELVDEGKVREIGNSNFDAAMLQDADALARNLGLTSFVSAQNEWSLLARDIEAEVVPKAAELNLKVLPYFPLHSGVLTGKYKLGEPAMEGTRLASGPSAVRWLTDDKLRKAAELEMIARNHGLTLLELAVSWLAAQSQVASVITGVTNQAQVRENAEALRDIAPSLARDLDGFN